jgi:hypothetical protein
MVVFREEKSMSYVAERITVDSQQCGGRPAGLLTPFFSPEREQKKS